jgi:hypothetical protein
MDGTVLYAAPGTGFQRFSGGMASQIVEWKPLIRTERTVSPASIWIPIVSKYTLPAGEAII